MSGHLDKGDVDFPWGSRSSPGLETCPPNTECQLTQRPQPGLCGPSVCQGHTHTHACARDIKVIFLVAGKAQLSLPLP